MSVGLPQVLVAGAALASLVELLVLRTFTRTAIHIPALEQLAGPYQAVAFAGRYAYFVALVLLVAALSAAVWALWQLPGWLGKAAAAAVGAFFAVASAAAAGLLRSDIPGHMVTIGAVVFVASMIVGRGGRMMAPAAGLYAAAFAFSGMHTVVQAVVRAGVPAPESRWLLMGSEVFGVGFALASLLLVGGRVQRGVGIAALAIGVGTFGLLLGQGGATVRILLLWNQGLSGALPAVAYGSAAAALAATLFTLARSGRLMLAASLMLLVTGGLGLHSTYQSGLVITGLTAMFLQSASGLALRPVPAAMRDGRVAVGRHNSDQAAIRL